MSIILNCLPAYELALIAVPTKGFDSSSLNKHLPLVLNHNKLFVFLLKKKKTI